MNTNNQQQLTDNDIACIWWATHKKIGDILGKYPNGLTLMQVWQAEGCPGKEQTPDPMDKWDDLRRAHTSAEQAENDAREDDVYGRYPEPTESKNVDLAAENKALKEMCEQYERDNKVLLDRLNEVIRENNDMQNNNDQLTEALEYVINEISALPEKGNTGRTIVESLCLDKATAALSNTPQIETTDGSGAMAD